MEHTKPKAEKQQQVVSEQYQGRKNPGPVCKVDLYQTLGIPLPGGCNPKCPAALGKLGGKVCKLELMKCLGFNMDNGMMGDAPPTVCRKRWLKGKKRKKCNKDMESVVRAMEEELRSIQKELELVQAERRGLELQKKLLSCTANAVTTRGAQGDTIPTPVKAVKKSKPISPQKLAVCSEPEMDVNDRIDILESKLLTMKEKYKKLQQDYNCKVEEVAMVRVELEAAKRDVVAHLAKTEEAEGRVEDLLERLKAVENQKVTVTGSKDKFLDLEQQLSLTKQKFQESSEEVDEMRTNMEDMKFQLDDYRCKYLNAQQTIEEQRRQLDLMEVENSRVAEQVNLEIQRVKTQFQEKLQELSPLPDMLKATQTKLQESQQLKLIAERTIEQLKKDMAELGEKHNRPQEKKHEKSDTSCGKPPKESPPLVCVCGDPKLSGGTRSENAKLRATIARLEELAINSERKFDEKCQEALQLASQLECLREQSARQVARTKDRCETVRRNLQAQITDLETQLAQTRASACAAQKDRDEIRQKMQAHIRCLNENFEQAQMRVQSLQAHVNYLKPTNMYGPESPCVPGCPCV